MFFHFSDSDDDFVKLPPKKKKVLPSIPLHPILGDRKFPSFPEGPLSAIEKLPSKQKHSIITSKVRLALRAVKPGLYGKGSNHHWDKMIHTRELKSPTSLSIVGDKQVFSLSMFLPWDKLPSEFNKGPAPEDFVVPGISWAKFKVFSSSNCNH